ncbi:hypothetical protein, partial [Microbulbifer harenosus]|uniref:hypothetical protein n=1 Tax=Microbulbifer harenosus TaxID=2576840 RepID=UPI001C6FDB32
GSWLIPLCKYGWNQCVEVESGKTGADSLALTLKLSRTSRKSVISGSSCARGWMVQALKVVAGVGAFETVF